MDQFIYESRLICASRLIIVISVPKRTVPQEEDSTFGLQCEICLGNPCKLCIAIVGLQGID